jgi:hypothetical protein
MQDKGYRNSKTSGYMVERQEARWLDDKEQDKSSWEHDARTRNGRHLDEARYQWLGDKRQDSWATRCGKRVVRAQKVAAGGSRWETSQKNVTANPHGGYNATTYT